jgi:hypothetical protein
MHQGSDYSLAPIEAAFQDERVVRWVFYTTQTEASTPPGCGSR